MVLVPSNSGAMNTLANTHHMDILGMQGEVLVNSQENAKSFFKVMVLTDTSNVNFQ